NDAEVLRGIGRRAIGRSHRAAEGADRSRGSADDSSGAQAQSRRKAARGHAKGGRTGRGIGKAVNHADRTIGRRPVGNGGWLRAGADVQAGDAVVSRREPKVAIGPECDKKCSGLRDVELGGNAGRGYSSNFGLPADDVPKVAIGPGGDTPSA